MAERSYNGRLLNTNPTMAGTGSTTAENAWVGDASFLWRVGQVSSGNNILTEYTTFDGRPCIKMAINSLVRTGGTIGQIYIGNLAEYAGGTINAANLALYGIKVRPNYTYNISVTYYIESIGADTGSTNFFAGCTYYNSNGTRNTSTPSSAFTVTQAAATIGQWVTSTGTFTETETNMGFLGLRIGFGPGTDPTTNGNAVIYISNISLTEVLPARTLATSRTTASNRVAVRDMGTALRFDGGGTDRVNLGSTIDGTLATSGTFTLDVYAKRTNGVYAIPICLAGGGLGKIGIAITATGTVQGRITNGANTEINFASTRTVANNTFNRLTLTFDGSTARIYINGTLAATQAYVGLTVANDVNYVGQRPTNNDRFNGIIDEPRIWNRALTADEVQKLYLYGIVPRDGLVAEYLFDEASGTTALDTSGNGNDGTITGATYTTDTPLQPRTSV